MTVTALNDGCLFRDWVESNKPFLQSQFGRELKKYGLWVVTVTFTAPGCSINAWLDKDKEALLSAKAKASMVGDYRAQLDWTDQITDKDWCHYSGDPTKWSEKDMKQVTSQPGSTAQIQILPKRSEQRDPTCPVIKLDIPTMKAATASRNDQQPNSAQDLDGQPASRLAMKADSSPVVNYSNLRSDTHEASAERTPPNLHPVPRPKSPSIDRRNGRQWSPSNTGVAGMKAPRSCPAKNDGVVLFFDGIRVGQMEWWTEVTKTLPPQSSSLVQPDLEKALQVVMNDDCRNLYQRKLPLASCRFGRPRILGKSITHYILHSERIIMMTQTRLRPRKRRRRLP